MIMSLRITWKPALFLEEIASTAQDDLILAASETLSSEVSKEIKLYLLQL